MQNTNTSQMLEKSVQNKNEEKMNKIHDDLAVTNTPSDEATHGNLHKTRERKQLQKIMGQEMAFQIKRLIQDFIHLCS